MKQGTMSVLLGCHSPLHSLMVLITWRKLYHRWPVWWEIICIFLHDIGHWGTQYLDNYEEKKNHWVKGAILADKIFDSVFHRQDLAVKGFALIMGHCSYDGQSRSELYLPDKYSWIIAPTIWMLSNQIFEPKLIRKGKGRLESVYMFKKAMKENEKTGFKEQGHDIYLRQWGHSKEINHAHD